MPNRAPRSRAAVENPKILRQPDL